jgi:hypothetical protein
MQTQAKKIRAKSGQRRVIDANLTRWQYEHSLPGRAEKIARAHKSFNPPRWVG